MARPMSRKQQAKLRRKAIRKRAEHRRENLLRLPGDQYLPASEEAVEQVCEAMYWIECQLRFGLPPTRETTTNAAMYFWMTIAEMWAASDSSDSTEGRKISIILSLYVKSLFLKMLKEKPAENLNCTGD